MKIAVLSGKGGTGKTFVSTNLSRVIENSVYLDCDVEEPNGHLFLEGPVLLTTPVALPIPVIDNSLCDGCKKCVDFCQFNALAYANDKVLVFDKICHSCGGCEIICPQNAISEIPRKIGEIQKRTYRDTTLYTGILNTGEESGTAIIGELLNCVTPDDFVVIDCPPGSSCVVMDSIKDADYCVIVTEPSIFGSHNLRMVHELVELFNKPIGIVLNKTIGEENPSEQYSKEHNLPILLEIPWSSELGMYNAEGKLAVEKDEEFREMFSGLLLKIKQEVVK
ncbi:4Fe-4S binding protein [Gudongella sp. DL1XJH-153]|uniref:nucleotide-binding protein n=1 Tax=Gudongella sp. DL1XJH-153 TaxID=3409804 RepID=UPI003BB67DAD